MKKSLLFVQTFQLRGTNKHGWGDQCSARYFYTARGHKLRLWASRDERRQDEGRRHSSLVIHHSSSAFGRQEKRNWLPWAVYVREVQIAVFAQNYTTSY